MEQMDEICGSEEDWAFKVTVPVSEITEAWTGTLSLPVFSWLHTFGRSRCIIQLDGLDSKQNTELVMIKAASVC